jgi:hypothetical protein
MLERAEIDATLSLRLDVLAAFEVGWFERLMADPDLAAVVESRQFAGGR